jgi:hypothetical protein
MIWWIIALWLTLQPLAVLVGRRLRHAASLAIEPQGGELSEPDDLENRVEQFRLMELPGQPRMIAHGDELSPLICGKRFGGCEPC